MDKIKKKYNKKFKKFFGFKKLKSKQFKIIYNLLEKNNDVFGILTTGYGKSICYQLPLFIAKKSVLVVSPLIALMEDQKLGLEEKGIEVCCLNSTNKNKNKDQREILMGNNKIIYTTPEYLLSSKGMLFLENLVEYELLAMIAIDESHCVSSWGHDFRKDYLGLGLLKEMYPNIPLLALTATATQHVQDDIVENLKLEDPVIIRNSFDRPNLYIDIKYKDSTTINEIKSLINKFDNENIIIYCKTRKETEKISHEINTRTNYESTIYHAGLPDNERQENQEKFTNGEIKIIVSTIAFGMGIDQIVRCVIHYGMPKSVEAYYQEIGRAGRDGKPSCCYMFYSSQDMILYNHFINKLDSRKTKIVRRKQLSAISQLTTSLECRRKIILKHFGENYKKDNCKNCDRCIKKKTQVDYTLQTYFLAELLININYTYGPRTLINILRGSNAKNVKPSFKKLEVYGKGKQWKVEWWNKLINTLIVNKYINKKYINEKGAFVIEIVPKLQEWYDLVSENDTGINNINKKNRIFI